MATVKDLIVLGGSRLIGDAIGSKFITDGGTSSQFVKGDGTLDDSTYLTQTTLNSENPDLAAIEALSGTSGLLKKTAANTWTLDTNTYLTSQQLKTINNESLIGSGNITIQGGSGGDTNVIETVKVNGTALTPDSNKAVNISVPTKTSDLTNDSKFIQDKGSTVTSVIDGAFSSEDIVLTCSDHNAAINVNPGGVDIIANWSGSSNSVDENGTRNVEILTSKGKAYYNNNEIATVDQIPSAVTEDTVLGWGFTKDHGTYSKPSGGIPKTDLASAVQTSLGKADSAIQSVKVNGTVLTPDSNKAVDVTVPIAIYFGTYTQNTNATGVNDIFIFNLTTPWATIKADVDNGKEVILIFDKSDNNDGTNNRWEFYYTNTEAASLLEFKSKVFGYPCHLTYDSSGGISLSISQFALSSDLSSVATSGNYNDLTNKPTIPSAPGTLNTTATTAQSTSSSEALSGNITLHKVAKTGTYGDLIGAKTKLSEFTNDSGYIANNTFYNTITLRSTTTTLNSEDIILQTGANKIELNPTGLTYRDTKHFLFDDAVITTDIEGGVDAHWSTLSDSQLLSAAVIKTKLDELPTVNNATLTIQKNGTTVNTFTANASSNVTANIQVNELPTVSSSDNGKVLMVVNGAWAAVTPVTVYTGTSTPNNSQGNNGDLYVQTS